MSAVTTNATASAPASGATHSRKRRQLKHLVDRFLGAFEMFRNVKSLIGLGILLFFVVIAIFAPVIAPYDPLQKDYTALLQPPSAKHILGTTHMGEDLFSQIVWGTRGVLIVGFTVGVIATIVAIAVGVTAGYLHGWISEALSALANVFLVIPALPLLIIVSSQFDNPSILLISAVLAVTGWAWGARVLRAQTMSLRNRDFVQAARANGEPLIRIICIEMMPNLMSIIASSFVGTVNAAMLNLISIGLSRMVHSRITGGGLFRLVCASHYWAWPCPLSISVSTNTSIRVCARLVNVHELCARRVLSPMRW